MRIRSRLVSCIEFCSTLIAKANHYLFQQYKGLIIIQFIIYFLATDSKGLRHEGQDPSKLESEGPVGKLDLQFITNHSRQVTLFRQINFVFYYIIY